MRYKISILNAIKATRVRNFFYPNYKMIYYLIGNKEVIAHGFN
jgi:hypothetical protein